MDSNKLTFNIGNNENPSKIGIATLYAENYNSLADITVVGNKIPYCERHGYDLHAKTSGFEEFGFGFSKIQFLIDLFERYNYEWIYWCGADTLIMNYKIKLESMIDDDYHFIIAKDCHDINADSFFIKGSQEGLSFLKFIMSQYNYYKEDCWQEQRVMIHNEHVAPWGGYTKVVEQSVLNSYLYEKYGRDPNNETGQFRDGDFLVHMPGMSLEARINTSKYLLSRVIK